MIALAPGSTTDDRRPLEPHDFERLADLLDATGNEDAMVVEEIDGYLAALVCAPDPVHESEILREVLGVDAADDSQPPAAAPAVALEGQEEIGALLRRHAGRVVAALDAGEFGPVLAYDEQGNADGVAWAVGFLRGVEAYPDSWDALLDEKDFDDALDAIEALAAALDDESNAGPSRPGDREVLIDRMIADVADIHEFFRPYREAGTTPAALRVETVRRAQPKVGRNEPCPCGSGRKYKNCCGAN